MKFLALVAALLVPATLSAADAEDWPARPVRIIAPFAPGGTADTLGRVANLRLAPRDGLGHERVFGAHDVEGLGDRHPVDRGRGPIALFG